MRVSVTQQSLAKALSITTRAVSSRSSMPVLSNVLLEAKDDTLRLAGTNREIGISCWIAATVEDDGAITIPAKLLSEFVNSLPPERIGLELNERTQTLRLSCAKFSANIKGIDHNEFPLLPTYQPETTTEAPTVTGATYMVNPGHLLENINSVVFAASQDENRPTLTGVETTFDDGRLTMAATDGYRLSVRTCDAITQIEKNTVIIPARSLVEVARIAADATGDVTAVISRNRNQVLFSATGKGEWQRVDVVCELIDARFPDYMATVPKSYNTRTIIDTAALQKAVRVALLFARDNNNIVRFQVAPENNMLRLTATSGEVGDNISEIECGVEGESIEIAFNGRYVMDALGAITTPQVIIETTQKTRPGLIRPVGDSDFLMVTMPMHPPK